jgi:TnpA family transposase
MATYPGPESLQPRLRSICAVRNPGDPGNGSEAPYILDGLLMNDAGRHIREQFTDTGGFTDHVFAACAILGYRFAPRIRDLPSKRLYAFNPNATPAHCASADRRKDQ